MRIAALILILVLVVAIATEVDGWWRRGSRRRRYSRRPKSCSTCRRYGKRSEIYPKYDGRVLSDKTFYDKWQPLSADVPKSRQKRALNKLKFPRDCSSAKLQNFARRCGLCIVSGGSHIKVCDGNRQITVIPHSVKSNGTCRNIINILNGRCT